MASWRARGELFHAFDRHWHGALIPDPGGVQGMGGGWQNVVFRRVGDLGLVKSAKSSLAPRELEGEPRDTFDDRNQAGAWGAEGASRLQRGH